MSPASSRFFPKSVCATLPDRRLSSARAQLTFDAVSRATDACIEGFLPTEDGTECIDAML